MFCPDANGLAIETPTSFTLQYFNEHPQADPATVTNRIIFDCEFVSRLRQLQRVLEFACSMASISNVYFLTQYVHFVIGIDTLPPLSGTQQDLDSWMSSAAMSQSANSEEPLSPSNYMLTDEEIGLSPESGAESSSSSSSSSESSNPSHSSEKYNQYVHSQTAGPRGQ